MGRFETQWLATDKNLSALADLDGWGGTLKPVVANYQRKLSRIYFRADAAFAMPAIYEYLEAERIKYAIRLPANQVLQDRIYLLKHPVGRPPNEVRRFHANFSYQAGSWTKPRAGWLHQHDEIDGAGRRLLQQARHLRAMDQKRQGCDQMDAIEVCRLLEEINRIHARVTLLEESKAAPRHLTAELTGRYYDLGYSRPTMEEYWERHNVTNSFEFTSAKESLSFLEFRNSQYPGYIELLPVDVWDGKTIFDFGCGPGHDLVGFSHWSRPKELIGVDISKMSLDQAKRRLRLHGAEARLIQVPYGCYALPIESASVDYVHCSGVLMLIEDPIRLLTEFRRVLKPDGELRLMVYNYDSLWLHLYVAYIVQLENGLYSDLDVRKAFSRTTDGEDCPLVHVWRRSEVLELGLTAGLEGEFLGAAISLWELRIMDMRFRALMDRRLRAESRQFLLDLEINSRGFPLHKGTYAGIDGCFRFKPISRPETS